MKMMSYTTFFNSHLLLLVLSLLLACSSIFALGATLLPEAEVEALKDIAKTLGKTDWPFDADPCGNGSGWVTLYAAEGWENAVTCNCTSTVCHVTSIYIALNHEQRSFSHDENKDQKIRNSILKKQNLPGKLPPELIRLPYLQEIDLTRNYLSGTIPPEWGALPLLNISLIGNRLTGSLPDELANITTLKSLVVEYNNFSGVLPEKFGNLPNLQRLFLTSNNFTGELPETFSGLTTLIDFRISDNSFSGKIPNFIQNWINLKRLAIQASGLTGPIPSGISLLTKLTDLRISDLNGPELSFPELVKMANLTRLMLRNCNITGNIPEYLGEMTILKTLDLSFNKLTGEIPRSFSGVGRVDYMFLTGNMLTGPVPEWLEGDNIDLSYNNFTTKSGVDCEPKAGMNLFASSSGGNTSSVSCLKTTQCSKLEALKDIAKTLGKTDWPFDADPCGNGSGWVTLYKPEGSENAVTCNCTSAVCHVTSIILKKQNLPGKLPPELIRLPYLQEIDLTRNYLSGTIPPEWGALPLLNISLIGNRLTGSLPDELANITTLKSLVVEYNNFSGVLPEKFGNLPNLQRLFLTSNNFTGELPETFSGLTTLIDFRISDNSFSGKIPNFIQNWINLKTLAIQASGLTGPIPSGISLLTKLTDLRISDLNGSELSFPRLGKMSNLTRLMLRNCNITGNIPKYLGEMTILKTLDLSFNKLTGEIPRSFSGVERVNYMFLTGNMLTGPVPEWLKGDNIDLSYNNFTTKSGVDCEPKAGMNLFASSSGGNTSSVSCLKTTQCSKPSYSLHINCGGKEVSLNENFTRPTFAKYEEDTDRSGPSSFYQSTRITNWASSNTGYFPDDDRDTDIYIVTNSSILSMPNPDLYMNARVSPISLTYFGFCMGNGIYTVHLHFAEIQFRNDKTYYSLGRRIFDIYIQGSLVLKDFNIASEAGGFGKAVVKNFTANITSNTLEIRLFWAGKGTIGIPDRGIYGPLISAISVDPNFEPPAAGGGISVGVVVGIVVGGIFIILLIFGIFWRKGCLKRERTLEQDLIGVDLQTSKFTLRHIKAATNDFDPANKIGEGGFGPVHKGLLSDGTIIAVKQLSAKSKQGNREFINEIGMISALQHPHLVKLYGFCIEGNQLLLVYEYLENNSLARALFGPEERQLKLDWPTRHNICVGIARGLAFLHEESRLKIVHRDIKATNVLLDKNLFPKISDFGLAKLDDDDNTHISTRIAGTYGYMAPEYAMRGYLTDKADVYSFGIVVLEIVSGRTNTTYRTKNESFYLLDWALFLKENGDMLELVDPRLGSDFNKEEMMITINVALLCTNVIAADRPTMSSVVSMLEGKAPVQDLVMDPNASKDEINKMRKHFQSTSAKNMSESSQRQTMSIEGSYTASSTSANDLYPINPDSNYWENRN